MIFCDSLYTKIVINESYLLWFAEALKLEA